MIGPANKCGIRPFQIEHIVGNNLPVLVGRIQIKQNMSFSMKKRPFLMAFSKILRANVIIGIKGEIAARMVPYKSR